MHLFQSSPQRPTRNPARIHPSTSTPGFHAGDGSSSSIPFTLSDIVLVKRNKSTGTSLKQHPSRLVRPRSSSASGSIGTAPSQRQPRPGTSPLSQSNTNLDHTRILPADTSPIPPADTPLVAHPRPRPVTAPYPSSSRPRTAPHPGTPNLRPSNSALALLLASKPPPPPPPLHPQPPPLRFRSSFSAPRPFPDPDSNSHASRPRPASSYLLPTTTTSKASYAPANHHVIKPSPPPTATPASKPKSQPPQFSTADRTILEELKRSISVKAAQFVIKGKAHSDINGGMSTNLGKRGGGRHHPFSKEEVPYPRSYERDALDLDVWETVFCEQISQSLTWHVFEEPPTKVLDIGSGTGTWILDCARLWKNCHFVGLDIVPLHPDLQQVGSSDLASRITWVQENFLNGLPFPNEEFDFVHIKRIARGVPEDKWDSLFEEITRVMKPGGAFEMIEEDLFFPGKDPDADDAEWSCQTDSEFHSRLNSTDDDAENLLANPYTSTTPTANVGESPVTLPPTPPHSTCPSPFSAPVALNSVADSDLTPPARKKSRIPESQSKTPSQSPSLQQVPLPRHSRHFPKLKLATQGHFQLHMPPRPPSRAKYASSAASLISPARPSTSSSATLVSGPPTGTTLAGATPSGQTPQGSESLPPPPVNPRNHRLLEMIYGEMHAARFINLSPLSLLTNTLGLHFKDVRTHPPLQFTFPPRPAPRRHDFSGGCDSDSSDSDDARNALHNPYDHMQANRNEYRWLSKRNLLEGASPYVLLDDTRLPALAPSSRSPRSPGAGTTASSIELSPSGSLSATETRAKLMRLPNSTLHFDLRTLNLHLALRTADTLGCAEAMWEWVEDYQAAHAAQEYERVRDGPGQRGPQKGPADMIRTAINTLTRADFDALLTKFDLDMRDHVGLEPAMNERFAWSVFPTSPTSERKVFDAACAQWEQWERQEQQQQQGVPSRGTAGGRRSRANGNYRRLSRAMRVFVAWKA